MAEIVILVRHAPESVAGEEALRLSIGLTLSKQKVTVVFAGEGIEALLPEKRWNLPDTDQYLKTLGELQVDLFIAEGSPTGCSTELKNLGELAIDQYHLHELIGSANKVVVW